MDISVLGAGNMGGALASGLLSAGHSVTVWNRSRERAERLIGRGAHVVDTPAEAIRASSHIIIALSNESATRQVLFSDNTKRSLRGRALVSIVGMTSVECVALARDVTAAGGRLSDVQITTYPQEVEARRSEFLFACNPEDKEEWRKIFGVLGQKVHDVGSIGSACAAQVGLAMGTVFLTVAIAYSVATFDKVGLPIDVIKDLLTDNPDVGISQAQYIIPEMSSRVYTTGRFSVDSMAATLDMLIAFGSSLKLETAALQAISELYTKAASLGYGDKHVAAVYEVLNPRLTL